MNSVKVMNKTLLRLNRGMKLLKQLEVNVEESLKMRQRVMSPNHSQIVVIGGGLSGTTMIGRLVTNGRFTEKQVQLIDKQAYTYIKEGLDLFVYDLAEEDDVKKVILQRIADEVMMKFEEVIHFDPTHNYIGTFEGTELTYDYCLLCPGMDPALERVAGLQDALQDKFCNVVSTFDIENAIKMKKRLEHIGSGDIYVYCSGREGNDSVRPINHALLLKAKFPNKRVSILLNGDGWFGEPIADKLVADMIEQKEIEIHRNMRLIEVPNDSTAIFQSGSRPNDSKRETISFALLYVEPPYRQPKWLTDAKIRREDFDPLTCMHQTNPTLFAHGSYLAPNLSTIAMLERSFPCAGNMVYQMLCDYGVDEFDYNKEMFADDNQTYRFFPTKSSIQTLDQKGSDGSVKLNSPSKLLFYNFALFRYTRLLKHTKKGKDFGSIGYHMPRLSQGKSRNMVRTKTEAIGSAL